MFSFRLISSTVNCCIIKTKLNFKIFCLKKIFLYFLFLILIYILDFSIFNMCKMMIILDEFVDLMKRSSIIDGF